VKLIGSQVEVVSPQGSTFTGRRGKVVRRLDARTYVVRFDRLTALPFGESELVTTALPDGEVPYFERSTR
jgi:RNase P/RNase MRP subunit p29